MRFILDAQLPPALAAWISARRHQADHVFHLNLIDTSDHAIWDAALETGAVILTKDHDFVEWATTREPAPQVVWIRIGNASTASLIAGLEPLWARIAVSLEAGARVVEAG